MVFEGASNQVTNAVTFSNTGGVTLGNGGDEFLFDGGLTSAPASTTTLNGNVRTSGDAVLLGAVTLAGNSVVDTTNAGNVTDGNDITLGAVTGAAFNLELNAGNGDGSDISGTSVSNAGTLTITQADSVNFSGAVNAATITLTDTNDTLTFQGNVTATTLNTAAQGYAVVFEGASNQVTNAVTFSNTGGVTLGNGGDEFLFDRRADKHGQHHNPQRQRAHQRRRGPPGGRDPGRQLRGRHDQRRQRDRRQRHHPWSGDRGRVRPSS